MNTSNALIILSSELVAFDIAVVLFIIISPEDPGGRHAHSKGAQGLDCTCNAWMYATREEENEKKKRTETIESVYWTTGCFEASQHLNFEQLNLKWIT